MSHLAIYRKYRPSNFDEVSGQKIVVNILKNAIKSNNISHAYLFTGPRGTGKTSIAKIFARTVNCQCLKENNPCDECNSCLNSLSKECVDIIEIDAASNNGVDEIRELKSKINIVPSFLKYKIYIIDEVHMLSIGAFNALLKTLEEPPSHAIFILATTEIHKVPATILSRCQVLEFKRISPKDMKNRMMEICSKEDIQINEIAIEEIVRFSDGCMRDALSLLEKINAYCNGNITLEDVRLICGKPEKEHILEFIENLKNKEINKCIEMINYFYQNDHDMLYIVEDIINEVDQIIFKKTSVNLDNDYNLILSELIKIYDNMKKSSVNKKIIFEIGILNFFGQNEIKNISREIFIEQKHEQNDEKKYDDKTEKIKKQVISNNEKNEIQYDTVNLEDFKKIRINNTFAEANKEELQIMKIKWEELKKFAFDKEYGAKICILLDGIPVVANKNYLVLNYQYATIANKINEGYNDFENILKKFVSLECHIVGLDNDEWKVAKNEYIKKINSGEKYHLKEDNYIDSNGLKNDIINNKELNIEKNEELEDKIFELFDSEYVEIK